MLKRSDRWHAGALLLLGGPVRRRMSNSFQSQAIQAPGLSPLSAGAFVSKQLIQGAPLLQSCFLCALWHCHRCLPGGTRWLAGRAVTAHMAPRVVASHSTVWHVPSVLRGNVVMEKTSLSDVTRRSGSSSTSPLCAPPSHLLKLPSPHSLPTQMWLEVCASPLPLPLWLFGSLWLLVLFSPPTSLLHMPPSAVRSEVIFPTYRSHFQFDPCPAFFLPFLPHSPSVLSH